MKELRDVFARLEAQGYPRERQEVRLVWQGDTLACHHTTVISAEL